MSTFTREDLASLSDQENVFIPPEDYHKLQNNLFEGNTTIKSVTIPDGIFKIPPLCFKDCINLEHVRLSFDVKHIDAKAFSGCVSLRDVSFLETVRVVSHYAFNNCTGITNIHLIRGPTEFGDHAFSGCTSLRTVKLGSNNTYMGPLLFTGCTALEKFEYAPAYPAFVKSPLCFTECPNLKTLTFPPHKNNIYANLFYGSSIRAAFFKSLAVRFTVSVGAWETYYSAYSRDLRLIVYPDTEWNRETRILYPHRGEQQYHIHNITEIFPDLWFKGLKSDTGSIRWFKRHPVDAPEWRAIPGLTRADLARMLPEGHASFKTARMAASRASGGNALVLRELMKHYSFPELAKVEAFLRDEVGYRPVVSWVSTSTWLG